MADTLKFEVNDYEVKREIADARPMVNFAEKYGGAGTFLDLGANVGHVSFAAAKVFDKVVAVEAHPHTFARLKEKLTGTGATAINAAVFNESGQKMFISTPGHSTSATARKIPRLKGKSNYYAEIQSIKAQDLIDKYKPRVVKMDIEGCEYDIIPNTNFHSVEAMAIEYHGGKMDRINQCDEWLKNQGFVRNKPLSLDSKKTHFYFIAVYERKD